MRSVILALCLLAASLSAAFAETAQVTFSGTYAPYLASAAGSGGPFSTTLDYDSSRPAGSLSTSSFSADFFSFNAVDTTPRVLGVPARGLIQGPTFKVSKGVYNILFLYPLGVDSQHFLPITGQASVPMCQGPVVCSQGYWRRYVMIAVTANLQTDTPGYFDLSKVSFSPAKISALCAFAQSAQNDETSIFVTYSKLQSPFGFTGYPEIYKLYGTPTFTGNFYLDLSEDDSPVTYTTFPITQVPKCILRTPWNVPC